MSIIPLSVFYFGLFLIIISKYKKAIERNIALLDIIQKTSNEYTKLVNENNDKEYNRGVIEAYHILYKNYFSQRGRYEKNR